MRSFVLLIMLTWIVPVGAADVPDDRPLSDAACSACHVDEVSTWRAGPHGEMTKIGCVACHGEIHSRAGPMARQSQACITCHGGENGAVARSYQTSKHGVIVTLESANWDWSARLVDANYRAPTCAYCHMHDGAHGQVLSGEVLETSCLDCHSPRYVETLIESGRRTLVIGDLKLDEAIAAAADSKDPKIKQLLQTMQSKTLKNIRLGVGHQSPDYQWWYGHAALDGDLLRIKSAISQSARKRALDPK